MIVVDTNVILSAFVRAQGSRNARKALEKDRVWRVPRLWRSEFLSGAREAIRKVQVDVSAAMLAYNDALAHFALREMIPDPRRVLEACTTPRVLSSYDAEFLVLAADLGCSVVTEDAKFAAASKAPEIVALFGRDRVSLVEDYLELR